MNKKIAALTIGQSPRVDLADDLAELAQKGLDVIEVGALDGLTQSEIDACAPDADDYVLVSRLTDGTQVRISKKKISPLLQRRIDEQSANGVASALVMCSCDFPELAMPRGFLIHPSKALFSAVSALAAGKRLGIIMPTPEQVEPSRNKWRAVSDDLFVCSASPYVDPREAIILAARKIAVWGADICILDCAGFSGWMKHLAKEVSGIPTISALSVSMRLAAEILS